MMRKETQCMQVKKQGILPYGSVVIRDSNTPKKYLVKDYSINRGNLVLTFELLDRTIP